MKKKKKRKTGKRIILLLLILAVIAALYYFGFGKGNGFGTGEKETSSDVLTTEEMPESEENKIIKKIVEIKEDKVYYEGEEITSLQNLADKITENVEDIANIQVELQTAEAIYNTVEEVKTILEQNHISYIVVE